jgi:malonate transporter MadL subunit
MVIYGVAILSLSMLVGLFAGDLLGIAIGVKANVGGVGIAMLMLILLDNNPRKKLQLSPITAKGITFWSAMYIPIVVAMAAKQNVYGALSGGPLALLAGGLAVAGSFVLIPLMTKLSKRKRQETGKEPE